MWAAPWRQGANTNGLENNVYNPIADGWNYFVLDNALYYIPLVEIFLQRTATFNFAENPPPSGIPLATSNTLQHRSGQLLHTTSSNKPAADTHGQLQILYQLFNVLKTDCITQFLAELEECLSGLRSKAEGGAALMKNEKTCQQAIESFSTKYFYDHREAIGPKLEKIYDQLIQLGGGSWNPPHLYTAKLSPRADPLIKTLEALQQASQSKHDLTRGWGPGVHASSKSREHIKEIQRATELLKTIFSVSNSYDDSTLIGMRLIIRHCLDYRNSKTKCNSIKIHFFCSAKTEVKVRQWQEGCWHPWSWTAKRRVFDARGEIAGEAG